MTPVFHLFLLITLAFRLSGAMFHKSPPAATPVPEKHATIEDEYIIPWMAERKLTWDDFQSQPIFNSEAVALTSTSLGLTYKADLNGLHYQITCSFTKHKSWATMKTSYILAHEQAHFDITELFARRLNQSLVSYQFNPKTYKTDISKIYQQVVKEKEDFQHDYDAETDHSRNRKNQKEWLEKIDQMLNASAPFAGYP